MIPNLPREIWALKNSAGELVPPMDDDGTGVFLAWPSEKEAKQGLEHQLEMGYFEDDPEPEIVCLYADSSNQS